MSIVQFFPFTRVSLLLGQVHRVLMDIVSAAANGTPGLGRYPPFRQEVDMLASPIYVT